MSKGALQTRKNGANGQAHQDTIIKVDKPSSDLDAKALALYYFHLATIHEARARKIRGSLWWRARVGLVNLVNRLLLRKSAKPYTAEEYIKSARLRAVKLARKHRRGGFSTIPLPPGAREFQHLLSDGSAGDGSQNPNLIPSMVKMPMPDLYRLVKSYITRDDVAFLARLKDWVEKNEGQIGEKAMSILDLGDIALESRNGLYSIVVEKSEKYFARFGSQSFVIASMWQEFFELYSNALSRIGRHAEAGNVIDRGLSKLGKSHSLVRKKASILAWTGNYKAAVNELSRLERDRDAFTPRDQILKAHLLEMQRDYALAGFELERALSRPNCPADGHLLASNIALKQGDPVASRLAIDKFFAAYSLRSVATAEGDRPLKLGEIVNRRTTANTAAPLVSVIMTAFRAEGTVRYAVDSVLAQSHSNIELIVVEDAGNDGTLDALYALARGDDRVVVVANNENIGTYRSKNSVLRRARGKFVTFHDSDDWWHPDHVEEHVRMMTEHPDLVCTTSRWVRIDDDGLFQLARSGLFLHLNPASMFVRKDAFEEVGGFDSGKSGADSEFLQRLRTVFGPASVSAIAKPLAFGLHRPDSLTQSGEAAYDENRYSPVREAYRARWLEWQRQTVGASGKLYIPFEEPSSKFSA